MALQDLMEKCGSIIASADFVEGATVSFRDDSYLYVSAANSTLSSDEKTFVKFNRASVNTAISAGDSDFKALYDSVCRASASDAFPSDALVYAALPCAYAARITDPVADAVACSSEGAARVKALFADKAAYIPGGLTPAQIADRIKDAAEQRLFFVCGYGVYVCDDSAGGLADLCRRTVDDVRGEFGSPKLAEEVTFDRERASYIAPQIRMLIRGGSGSAIVKTDINSTTARYINSANSFKAVDCAYTYATAAFCGVEPLFVEYAEELETQRELISEAIEAYSSQHGRMPSVVAVQNTAVFAFGRSKRDADAAADAFKYVCDMVDTASALGGLKPLPQARVKSFLDDYAANYELFLDGRARIEEKIVVVTGAAQGFGQGIADSLLEHGCNLVIADLNDALASRNSAAACAKYGRGKAVAVKVDVSNEESVHELLTQTALEYGGIDLFVSNAGIARSGNIEQTTKQSLEFHIAVNYTGFFLCSKYASRLMKIQYQYDPSYYADIVQINSKSGLEGSNKNFAYAGSKFGGIGLVQSFALELVEYNIKVNAVCPGNYLDGPLWSDPEKGLFVQYLNSGKVPGAKTVDDVRRHYESKVPMSRGCLPSDVAAAVIYCTEQKYETGQAIPVSGGQVMLK